MSNRWVPKILTITIAVTLSVVVISPVALSSQDLVQWARSNSGLGLSGIWPYVVFVALDCAAALCIAMTVHSYWRGEAGGSAHLLVWVFACGSAFANWEHSTTLVAKDAVWFFPAMSLLGAVLLEVVIRKVRRWAKASEGAYEAPLPSFRMLRWIVATGETYRAWKVAVVEGVSTPQEAISMVRGVDTPKRVVEPSADLLSFNKADAIRHAFTEIGAYDVPKAVEWLADRGISVTKTHAHNISKKEREIAQVASVGVA